MGVQREMFCADARRCDVRRRGPAPAARRRSLPFGSSHLGRRHRVGGEAQAGPGPNAAIDDEDVLGGQPEALGEGVSACMDFASEGVSKVLVKCAEGCKEGKDSE